MGNSMLFYIMCTSEGEPYISPVLKGDRHRESFEALLPGIPLALAQGILKMIKPREKHKLSGDILKTLEKVPGLSAQDWRWERLHGSSAKEKGERSIQKEEDLISRSEGRQLSEVDLQRLGNESGQCLTEVIEFCEKQVRLGKAEWIPAVQREGSGWRCGRCGETCLEEWPSIYGVAATCPSCASLGALSSLQVLYRCLPNQGRSCEFDPLDIESFVSGKVASEYRGELVVFSPHWELSPAQKRASQKVLDYVSKSASVSEKCEDVLLWAACGAGKTEVCFPAAAWALNQGQTVLFAAPRQDVVLDVAPRLKRDFPGLNLSILTGTSPERFAPAKFVLATTHQVLRFFNAFDLIFLDEMDAFPYHGNSALAWGLKWALKPSGRIVYLTATPSPESLEKVRLGKMELVRLPARHHRKALPIPEWFKFSWDLDSMKPLRKGTESAILSQWICDLSQSGPVLLFVPKISWVNPLVSFLRKEFPYWKVSGSYSSDPERKEKVEGLRNKNFQVFVSTSILERGVTVPDAQVIVLAADHEVFDERALVQMAGRVGRTQENPEGRALLLAKKKTAGIDKAIRWIEEMNVLALEQGLIDCIPANP
jgi:competence protein ComFA